MRIALTLLASSALLAACSASTSSRNIRTAGVVALVDVTSTSAGQSVVDTELVIGGANSNTNVVLEGGDALQAEAAGQRVPMGVAGKGEYTARFAVSEGEFLVALVRDVDAPAPSSRGTMGLPFELTPLDHAISRAGESLTISWTPVDPEAQVELELEGDCLIHEQRTLGADTGQASFAPGELRAWKNKAALTCPVTATVRRTRTGSTDPALDPDSRFRLHQVRSFSFSSAP
jgi:hypothetical protein